MEKSYTYEAEDKNNYQIIFELNDSKRIKLSFSNNSSQDLKYTSEYQLDELNEKFRKIIHFKEINLFHQCLIDNLNKKSLILKAPYKNVITSIWKIFPKKENQIQTFTLISSKEFNKNISLIYFSNYTQSEEIVKKIEKQFQIEQKPKIDNQFYSQISYNNYFIQNMYFLVNKK